MADPRSAHKITVDVTAHPQEATTGAETAWFWTCTCGHAGIARHLYYEGAEADGAEHVRRALETSGG